MQWHLRLHCSTCEYALDWTQHSWTEGLVLLLGLKKESIRSAKTEINVQLKKVKRKSGLKSCRKSVTGSETRSWSGRFCTFLVVFGVRWMWLVKTTGKSGVDLRKCSDNLLLVTRGHETRISYPAMEEWLPGTLMFTCRWRLHTASCLAWIVYILLALVFWFAMTFRSQERRSQAHLHSRFVWW